jgi:hypothetical protein
MLRDNQQFVHGFFSLLMGKISFYRSVSLLRTAGQRINIPVRPGNRRPRLAELTTDQPAWEFGP